MSFKRGRNESREARIRRIISLEDAWIHMTRCWQGMQANYRRLSGFLRPSSSCFAASLYFHPYVASFRVQVSPFTSPPHSHLARSSHYTPSNSLGDFSLHSSSLACLPYFLWNVKIAERLVFLASAHCGRRGNSRNGERAWLKRGKKRN